MPRGGARAGAGSPPNLQKTLDLLKRQIDWIEAQPERQPVDLAIVAVNLKLQLNRLLLLAGLAQPPTTEAMAASAAEYDALLAQLEAEDIEKMERNYVE